MTGLVLALVLALLGYAAAEVERHQEALAWVVAK